MPRTMYWADAYLEKSRSARDAIRLIKSGQRVFIGSACGQPQELVRALSEAAARLSGLEIVRLLSTETTPLSALADQTQDFALNLRTIYLGASNSELIARHQRFIAPMNMSEVPDLFTSKKLPIHAALIQVSPPDDFGWMSLGISVDVTLAAAMSADLVIAQVNPRMPRVLGRSFIHANNVDIMVEHEEPLLSVESRPTSETATRIGQMIARLVEDGSTIQIGLDAASQATLHALGEKNDLSTGHAGGPLASGSAGQRTGLAGGQRCRFSLAPGQSGDVPAAHALMHSLKDMPKRCRLIIDKAYAATIPGIWLSISGSSQSFRHFDKLDVTFRAFLCFALVVDALRQCEQALVTSG